MQKNEVKCLIESIKSQTEQLKNTVRNCVGVKKVTTTSPNSNEPSFNNDFSNKRIFRKKLNHEISEVLLPHRHEENLYQDLHEPPRNKKLMDDLVEENHVLKDEVLDLRNAIIALMGQYKLLKKDLDDEKRKTQRLTLLEVEYLKEKKKNQSLHERNFELKKQALSLINKIKVFLTTKEKEDQDFFQETSCIENENNLFRNLMQTPLIQPFTPQKEGPNTKQQPLDLHILKENYKKIKEERKEMKEKQRMDEKNKKETSQIFSYFPSSGSSVSELFEQNAIIDMYEEKILQNSIKSSSSFASIGSLSGKEDKSPKIIKKK